MGRTAALLIWFGALCASAAPDKPQTFEQLVLDSDLVGVVRCEVAGVGIARFRMEETWKGSPPPEAFSVRLTARELPDRQPVALCGERYLLAGFREASIRRTEQMIVPGFRCDFGVPPDQGLAFLPVEGEADFRAVASGLKSLQEVHAAMDELLKAAPAEQELRYLRALSEASLGAKFDAWTADSNLEQAGIARRVREATAVKELVAALLDLARIESSDAKEVQRVVREILVCAPGARTYAILDAMPANESPFGERPHRQLVDTMRNRLNAKRQPPREAEEALPSPARAPLEKELEQSRSSLARWPDSWNPGAFEMLARYDPPPVVRMLQAYEPRREGGKPFTYHLATTFGALCGGERTVHLKALVDAKDPLLRVAGQVFLCFDDLGSGMTALKDLEALDGDPGAWAALTRARRGAKDSMPRALRLFEVATSKEGDVDVRHLLQGKLIVLLSNSAHAGGGPPPPWSRESAASGAIFDPLNDWWKENEARIQLVDPWLPLLEEKRSD